MKIISFNFFEPIDKEDAVYMPFEDIVSNNLLHNYKEFPDHIVVENEFNNEDEIVICNEHWFQNPKDDLIRTLYSPFTKLVGVWNINYKSA